MKRTSIALIAAGGLLAGCVGYETSVSGPGYGAQGSFIQGSYYTTDGRLYTSGGTGPFYTSDGRAYYTRDGNHYYQRRDRDGDGVPNRQDRAPNNPYRN